MRYYNNDRINHGKRCKGRTPYETFLEGKEIYQRMVYEGKIRVKKKWFPSEDGNQRLKQNIYNREFVLTEDVV